MRASGFVDFSKTFDQPIFVNSPDLIQDYLTGFSLKSDRYPGGVGASFRRHGSDDNRVDMMIHFVRRDDQTRTGFSDLMALRRIKADEEYIEARSYHVQSFRSHSDEDGESRSMSLSSPSRCIC